MTDDINEWGEGGKWEGCLDWIFGIHELWRTFLYFLDRVSLCWLEGGRRLRRGGVDLLFHLPWCLGWYTN